MKRNADLIRNILLDVEAAEPSTLLTGFNYEGFDKATVDEHVALLIDGGYLDGVIQRIQGGGVGRLVVFRLTLLGHDFVETARNDTRWGKAKTQITNQGLPMTIDILKSVLAAIVKQQLGKIGLSLE